MRTPTGQGRRDGVRRGGGSHLFQLARLDFRTGRGAGGRHLRLSRVPPRLIRPIMSAQVVELRFRCRPCMPTCSHGASTFPLVNGDISSSGGGTSVEPAAICLTAAVRRTGTRHDRRGPTRRPDRRLARDRRHRRPRSGASTGHCGRTVSTGPRCSSRHRPGAVVPAGHPRRLGYSPPCRRCSPAAQGSTWPGRAGRVPVAGQPTASSSRARISRVSGPRSGAVAGQAGGRRRVDQGKCLDEHIWCLVAAEPAGEGQPRRGESRQRRGG